MTQKELAYVEDAIGHEQNIIKIIEESLTKTEDNELIDFMQNELTIHENMHKTLMTKLEEKND